MPVCLAVLATILPDSWAEVGRVVLTSAAVYAFVIASHRVVGKRAASQMNNFDWIVTVAMGAIIGSTILSREVSLVEGLLAVTTLLGLQFGLTRAAVQWDWFRDAVQPGPRLIYYEGLPLRDAMKRERIMESEVLQAARDAGKRSLHEVSAVVLEVDGSLSVISAPESGRSVVAAPLLNNVSGLPGTVPPPDDPAAIEPSPSDTSDAQPGRSDEGTPLKRSD